MRLLPMPTHVTESLATLRTFQRKAIDKLNRDRKESCHHKGDPLEWQDESLVIMSISGRRLHPTTLSNWWESDRKVFGLEGITFHELRHTFLSMLAINGVHPKVMQELAEHADIQTTMNVYTHVNLDAKRQVVDVLDKALVT